MQGGIGGLGGGGGGGRGGIFNIGKAHFTKSDKNTKNKVSFIMLLLVYCRLSVKHKEFHMLPRCSLVLPNPFWIDVVLLDKKFFPPSNDSFDIYFWSRYISKM